MSDIFAKHLLHASWRALLGIALVLLLNGCKLGPNFHSPQTEVPAAWVGTVSPATPQTAVATTNVSDLSQWWTLFKDTELTSLIERAITTNLDLQIAEARLREARASRGITAGGLWPSVTAGGSYQRVKVASSTIPGTTDQNLYLAGLDAVWELDVFGGLRRNVEAAGANIQAAQATLQDVQVSLAAEVALDYAQLRGYQQQIIIAEDNLKAQRHTADLTKQRFAAGLISGLDVANANAQVATTEAQIPDLETSARQSVYALSVLLARPPETLLNELSPSGQLPSIAPTVPAGLPSDLLRRRPDIRVAEAQLHAATAQIGVAVADLFPKFSLTGALTYQNNLLRNWFTDPSRAFSFGPTVTWPLLQGGSVVSNIRLQRALRDESYLTYQKTVLIALQDVENALVAFNNEQSHRDSLNTAVEANRKAVDLATQLYTQGQTDFLNVLQAQGSLFVSEDALVRSQRSLVTDLIALYKALGGGWDPASS